MSRQRQKTPINAQREVECGFCHKKMLSKNLKKHFEGTESHKGFRPFEAQGSKSLLDHWVSNNHRILKITYHQLKFGIGKLCFISFWKVDSQGTKAQIENPLNADDDQGRRKPLTPGDENTNSEEKDTLGDETEQSSDLESAQLDPHLDMSPCSLEILITEETTNRENGGNGLPSSDAINLEREERLENTLDNEVSLEGNM